MTVTDLLERPVYGMSQVDRLLGLRGGTAVRWIDGYRRQGRAYPPVVRAESTGSPLVTWGEFVETRLLAEFRSSGVPIIHLRDAVQRLREQFSVRYPLAHVRPWVLGRELVAEVQDAVGLAPELRLVVLRTGQYLLTPPAEAFFKAVTWDESSGNAAAFAPDATNPRVTISPLVAFGEPAVQAVKTEVLAEEHRAGTSAAELAEAFGLELASVEDALRYETHLAGAA